MPETIEMKQWVCLNCHKPIYPWNNLRCNEIYVCPSCQTHWKIIQIADACMEIEKVTPEWIIHKCPASGDSIVKYYHPDNKEIKEANVPPGWYIKCWDGDFAYFFEAKFCPNCGQELKIESSYYQNPKEYSLTRVQALELD